MIKINVNNTDFLVDIIYKRKNRRIYLRVRNGILVITTPTKLSTYTLKDMISRNYNSIIKNMNESNKVEDSLHFLGKKYYLVLEESELNNIEIAQDKIKILFKDSKIIPQLVNKFYTEQLKKIVKTYENMLIFEFDVKKPVSFKYKNVKTYYGECFPKKGLIILSTRLAKYELKYILSVLYHEFAHFKYMHHQKDYYEYLESKYPNYKKVQHELRTIKYNDKY